MTNTNLIERLREIAKNDELTIAGQAVNALEAQAKQIEALQAKGQAMTTFKMPKPQWLGDINGYTQAQLKQALHDVLEQAALLIEQEDEDGLPLETLANQIRLLKGQVKCAEPAQRFISVEHEHPEDRFVNNQMPDVQEGQCPHCGNFDKQSAEPAGELPLIPDSYDMKVLDELCATLTDRSPSRHRALTKILSAYRQAIAHLPAASQAVQSDKNKAFVVVAYTSYEPSTVVKVFLSEEDANGFANACNQYEMSAFGNDRDKNWRDKHPAGWVCAGCTDEFYVTDVPFVQPQAAQPTPSQADHFPDAGKKVTPLGDCEKTDVEKIIRDGLGRQLQPIADAINLEVFKQASESEIDCSERM